MNIMIIAFGRGHCVVARADWPLPESGWITLTACTIRLWGTKNGLGELASLGPRKETILDAIPEKISLQVEAIHGIWHVAPQTIPAWESAIAKAESTLLAGGKK